MQNSRTKNSILIMATGGIRQVFALLLTFVSRTIFIKVLGADYLGLNGLFSNILSLLALSELGIGTAISFYLYKPLVDKDIERIKSLMYFYKVCYRVVGLSIIGIGCCLLPLLPFMVNFEQTVPVNLYIVYLIYLLNTASSYLFFAYKQALVTANQEHYKIEKINIVFIFINCLADIFVLIIARNYIIYLIIKLIFVLVKNIVIALKINKEYPYLKEKKVVPISRVETKNFFKGIGDVSLFRIGSTLFNTTDNIIISMLLGTVVVGYYSNYVMLITSIQAIIIGLIIKSFTAGIGNVVAKEGKGKQYDIFKQLDFIVYFIATVCTACLFQLLNSFIKIWIGGINKEYILSQTIVAFLCVSFYFDCTTQIMNSFREASGNFGTGKALQLIGGVVNIILSILWGKLFGLVGIFAATIFSKGVVTIIPFMIGVSKDVFEKGGTKILVSYIKNGLVTIASITVLWCLCYKIHMTTIAGFILECMLSVLVPVVILLLTFWKRPEMKVIINRVRIIQRKLK